jgi:hypothetical protein
MATHSCLRCGKRGPRHYRGAWYCDDHVPIAPYGGFSVVGTDIDGPDSRTQGDGIDFARAMAVIAALTFLAYLAWAWL